LLLREEKLPDHEHQVSVGGSARAAAACLPPFQGWVHFCSRGCSSYMLNTCKSAAQAT